MQVIVAVSLPKMCREDMNTNNGRRSEKRTCCGFWRAFIPSENQTITSWTGFKILVRNKHVVAKDSVGYLPTINAPATDTSTVYQVMTKSLLIKETLLL